MTDQFTEHIRDSQPAAASEQGERRLGSSSGGISPDDLDRGLARLDPLTVRPRVSSTILCLILAAVFAGIGFGAWWLGVRTVDGQSYEDMVWSNFSRSIPGWLSPFVDVFAFSGRVIAVCVVIGVVSLAVALARRRWWTVGQLAVFAALCFGAEQLKKVLPRPFLINTESMTANSAPSGHTILAAAAGMALIIVVPRAARALASLVAAALTLLVGLSVISHQWHRPSDVVMSVALVGAIGLVMIAATRTSGMDAPGSRMSSASVQIVASVLITLGVMVCLYAAYIIWQIEPGLVFKAQWARSGANASTVAMIVGIDALVFGTVLALRQLTAAPLSKIGLVGAPPAPPSK